MFTKTGKVAEQAVALTETELLKQEVEFWKKECARLNSNWGKTWQTFQVQYNEKSAQLELMKELVMKLGNREDGSLKYA